MTVVTDGLRSDGWRSFAKQKLQQLKDMGMMAKNYVVNGYRISLLTMDDIDKVRITAPAGAVVVADVAGEYQYRYADQYGGDFALTMSVLPAAGFAPRALFSGPGDVMYHGASDYSAVLGLWGTLSGAWYAPRAVLTASVSEPGGYLAGNFVVSSASPETTPTVGMGFTRNKSLYALAAVLPTPVRWFEECTLTVTRASLAFGAGLSLGTTYAGFKGRAFFTRPVWGEDAAIFYVFHNGGVCGEALGASAVLAYRQDVATDPFANAGTALAGQVSQEAIASALGLAAPCAGGDDGSALVSAMSTLLGSDWPFSAAPFQRGMFSYGTDRVCCFGPIPGGAIKGVGFAPTGTVEVLDIVIPAYDSAVYQPIVTEVSPGFYCCELWDESNFEFGGIHYGSPFGAWTELPHPAGTIIRHRTVKADATGIKALALVYDGAATLLHEYDSASGWAARGKAGDGKVTRADVALFGDHPFAHLAGLDSPLRRLW